MLSDTQKGRFALGNVEALGLLVKQFLDEVR